MDTSTSTPQAILRRYQQAILDTSADDLANLYAPDAVHELPFLFPGMPDRLEGRERVRARVPGGVGDQRRATAGGA